MLLGVHQGSLQGQRGQVTLKQHSCVIHGSVGEGCEGLAQGCRAQTGSEVGEDP